MTKIHHWRVGSALIAAFILVGLLFVANRTDRFRFPANESSAVGSLRTLYSANIAYATIHPQQGYPNKLADLALPLENPKGDEVPVWAVDPVLARGAKTGYRFAYTSHSSKADGKVDVYEITADPVEPAVGRERHFFMNETGVIRVSESGPATASSLALR
jgi:hypothetical protein